MLRLGTPGATRPRHLPGIEASSLPSPRQGRDSSTEVGIPTSLYTEVGFPTSVFCPKNLSPGQRRRCVSDAVLAASLAECFFTIHTPSRQSWRGHRIAPLNPGVSTGLPENPSPGQRRRSGSDAVLAASLPECLFHHSLALPSILAWAQELPLQSWAGRRIASPIPALATGLPRCITSSSGLELFLPEHRLVMESAPL